MHFRPLLLVLALGLPVFTGCASADDGAPAAGESADEVNVTSYDIQKSEKLLAEAVTLAEARQRHEVCENDAYVSTIIGKLQEAVKVRNTVYFRTKVIGRKQVLSAELGDNLAFKEILGTFQNVGGKLTGLETALASGVVVYGPAPGAYGNMSKLEFKANGALVSSTLAIDDQGNAKWTSKNATWSVDRTDAKGSRVIVAGKAYRVVQDGADYVLFSGARPDPSESFRSSPSECEA